MRAGEEGECRAVFLRRRKVDVKKLEKKKKTHSPFFSSDPIPSKPLQPTPFPVAVPGGHLLPPPAGSTPLPLPPPRTKMPPIGNEDFASPPSEAAFDAAAAAAGLAPWMRAPSPSFSSTKQRPLTLYAREAAAPLLRLAARAARGALAAHERALGTRYALPHLQVIAVPDFSANAMENWGERERVFVVFFLLRARARERERVRKKRKEQEKFFFLTLLSLPP